MVNKNPLRRVFCYLEKAQQILDWQLIVRIGRLRIILTYGKSTRAAIFVREGQLLFYC